jgi:hypothetical protein
MTSKIKDEIVTLPTAKLLKEKKFNIGVHESYTEYLKTHKSDNPSFRMKKGEVELDNSFYFINNHPSCDISNKNYIIYAAPTQSLAVRWLREVHDIFVFVNYRSFGVEECNGWYYHIGKSPDHYSSNQFKTYEEAMEAGLYEGLKLIP